MVAGWEKEEVRLEGIASLLREREPDATDRELIG